MSCGINSVFKKSAPYPLVVNFQNGNLKEGEHDIQGGLYSNARKNKESTAVIALNNMLYIGDEKREDNSYNLIVARNKITGDIRLIEVGNVSVKAFSELEQNQLAEDAKPKDEPDNRYQLGETFGSKRRKRILEQSKKLKVDIDSMKEQLEKTVNEKQLDESEVSLLNVEPEFETKEYAPPSNRTAEDVKDVYNIEDLVTQEQIEALQETANNVLETEDFGEYIEISEYMKNRIVSLKASSSTDKLTTCCIYLYTDCIIRYLSDPYKKVSNQKYTVCSYSESINKVVLDNFSAFSDKGRTRPTHLKDKAVCYTIVLLLLSSDYSISDAKELSKATSTPTARMSQMCKVVGAHYSGDSKQASIVLKLPLSDPPVMKKRRFTSRCRNMVGVKTYQEMPRSGLYIDGVCALHGAELTAKFAEKYNIEYFMNIIKYIARQVQDIEHLHTCPMPPGQCAWELHGARPLKDGTGEIVTFWEWMGI